jgi:Zn-dependent protease with chaperone function
MSKLTVPVSSAFRRQAWRAVLAILLFVVVYFLLLGLAFWVTYICALLAYKLINIGIINLLTIAGGLAILLFGVILTVFLLKFLMRSNQVDRSHLLEIREDEQPGLFRLIRETAQATGARFPKRVYLDADVNASVMYDSNFWSMFLPVKKNLILGLGLIQSLSVDELRATIAHEFGHFSQRSTKLGSYVYQVNRVIYDLMDEDHSFRDRLMRGGEGSWVVYAPAFLAMQVISVIQWILRRLYAVVNLNYLGLSREMEFHADAIAANVGGYEPMKSTLLKLPLSIAAWNTVLHFHYNRKEQGVKSGNLFPEHLFVIKLWAEQDGISVVNGFPQMTLEIYNRYKKTKLRYDDQWSSHPTETDRIARLEQLNTVVRSSNNRPATSLMENLEQVQLHFTTRVLEGMELAEAEGHLSLEQFCTAYEAQFRDEIWPPQYKGYYDTKNPASFEFPEELSAESATDLDDLFSTSQVKLAQSAAVLTLDIGTLYEIRAGELPIRTFEYEGEKYKQRQAKTLLSELEKQLEESLARLLENDVRIYQFFRSKEFEANRAPLLKKLYKDLFKSVKDVETFYHFNTALQHELAFVSVPTPNETIRAQFEKVAPLEEEVKGLIRVLLADDWCASVMPESMRTNFETYISDNWTYFLRVRYHDRNLEMLFKALHDTHLMAYRRLFHRKRVLLDYQVSLL